MERVDRCDIQLVWQLRSCIPLSSPSSSLSLVNSTPAPLATAQLDTLSDLQQEALYLAKADIDDLQVIGQGARDIYMYRMVVLLMGQQLTARNSS